LKTSSLRSRREAGKGVLLVVKAESYLLLTWYKQNKVMLAFQVLWPYLTVIMLVALGSSYGSMNNFARALGIKDPLLYILFSSFVVFTAAGIIDSATQTLLWHRWLGTLQYIALTPLSLKIYVLISSLVQTVIITSINLIALLPGALVIAKLKGLLDIIIVEAFIFLGSLPLLSLAALIALLSVMVKEESNIASFLNPLLLMISGVFYPTTILPRVLYIVSKYIPLTYVVNATKLLAASSTNLGREILFLASLLAIFSVVYNGVFYPLLRGGEATLKRRGIGT
jgi:ABC-2 type transport system permease protein